MPLQPISVPEANAAFVDQLFARLSNLSSDQEATLLLDEVDGILRTLEPEFAEFGLTLQYEVGKAVSDLENIRANTLERSRRYLQAAAHGIDGSSRPLERALALIAVSRTNSSTWQEREVWLREAVLLLTPLRERLDLALAMELLAEVLADAVSVPALEEAVSLSNAAILIRRQHKDIWPAIRAVRVLGQAALKLFDLNNVDFLRLAFECQSEAITALSMRSPSDHASMLDYASAVIDLAEVCVAGIAVIDEGRLSGLSSFAIGETPMGHSSKSEIEIALPCARDTFVLLIQEHDLAATLMLETPPVTTELQVVLEGLRSAASELIRRRIFGQRTLRYTTGLVGRLTAASQ